MALSSHGTVFVGARDLLETIGRALDMRPHMTIRPDLVLRPDDVLLPPSRVSMRA